ncbi:efflux RND transporter periplasmic adaptor subunit [Thermomonas sp.]|jgi:RND family efflux transporter MFP subunit|uniref:efflux RND transporter periplasmic adaptor subunit n=1 Tax=Thermomonas sp. TaxID=1971895 RepID=UPI001AD3BBBF|nr:efflux RND transporter periplasmic adaptor subunit [Xanthomonadales bacterium]MBN8768030.1 efflux RND transporter periplasmic adaptor subunit [Stenotrophomonas sp.]
MTYRPPVLLLCLLLAACGRSGDADDAAPATGTASALVTLATAERGAVAQTITVYGQVEAGSDSQRMLAAPVEALVAAIEAPAGSHVRQGQRIVRLQPSPATRAQWQSAVAEAQAAREALARTQRLRADGLASQAEVEAAQARLTTAEAQRSTLQARLAQLDLRAPAAGDVQRVLVNVGDLLAPGTPVASLAVSGAGVARFGIDPAQIGSLQVGAPVQVQPLDGRPPLAANVRSLSRAIDPQTRLATFLVDIPAGDAPSPGQPLTAQVAVASDRNAVVVPYAALLDDAGQPYVYVVNDGTAHRRDVRVGPTDGRRAAILSGVRAGEQVVVAGGTALEDGLKVRTR